MSDYDIHSCGYYCDRPVCIVAQRNELRDKLFSEQAVKTYSGGKPNYTQPILSGGSGSTHLIHQHGGWCFLKKDEPVARTGDCLLTRVCAAEGHAIQKQREWVGLTDEEVKTAWSQLWYDLNNGKFAASDDPSRHTTVMFARAIEAKLKEMNQ